MAQQSPFPTAAWMSLPASLGPVFRLGGTAQPGERQMVGPGRSLFPCRGVPQEPSGVLGGLPGVRSPGYRACGAQAVLTLPLPFVVRLVAPEYSSCPLCLRKELSMDAALLLRLRASSKVSSSCLGRTQRSISWNMSCILRRKKFRSSGLRVASSTSSHVAIVSSCRLKATFIEMEITL